MFPNSFGKEGMDNHRCSSFFIVFLLTFIIVSSCYTTAIGSVQHEEEEQQREVEAGKAIPVIETVKTMFSFPSSLPLTSTRWEKLKNLIKQWQAYISSPTVDFRDSSQEAQTGDGAAAGGKVKEAVIKSIDKGKSTMEDSAKSAAKLAEEAMHKTKDKVKSTFSFRDGEKQEQQQREEEL